MEKEITLEDIARRLDTLEKVVASLSAEKKKPKASIDVSLIGGKKVGHHVPVKLEKEIRFEHLGGRCVRRSPLWTECDQSMAETKPAESVEKEADARK